MPWESAVAFGVAVFVFAATPGPAILACVAQALGSGFRSALALAAGIVVGDVLFLLVAVYGLAVIADALGGLFLVVRFAGSAYLMWLGWKLWTAEVTPESAGATVAPSRGRGFRAGLLLTLGNPKVIVFYLGFLPAFMDLSSLRTGDVVEVVVLLVTVLMAVNASYAWMASRARQWVTGVSAVRRLNRVAGTVLATIGVVVAWAD